MADNFFEKIIEGDRIFPPQAVESSFFKHFPHPLSIEWFILDDVFEAIFYEEELEKIARFDQSGKLLDVKVNLSPGDLPTNIKTGALMHGELMNAILIQKEKSVCFEVIVRDIELNRYLLLFNDTGFMTKKEKL